MPIETNPETKNENATNIENKKKEISKMKENEIEWKLLRMNNWRRKYEEKLKLLNK